MNFRLKTLPSAVQVSFLLLWYLKMYLFSLISWWSCLRLMRRHQVPPTGLLILEGLVRLRGIIRRLLDCRWGHMTFDSYCCSSHWLKTMILSCQQVLAGRFSCHQKCIISDCYRNSKYDIRHLNCVSTFFMILVFPKVLIKDSLIVASSLSFDSLYICWWTHLMLLLRTMYAASSQMTIKHHSREEDDFTCLFHMIIYKMYR